MSIRLLRSLNFVLFAAFTVSALSACEDDPDDLGIDRGLAACHPPCRIDQLFGASDPLLEQVADARTPLGQEIDRMPSLDVLRQQQDAGAGGAHG